MSSNIKNVFCAMPWVHFHTTDNGLVKACCVANITYGNINTQSFESIWKSEKINKLRAQFAEGKSDHRCNYCLHIESAGGQSIRQETLQKFKSEISISHPKPVYFDIRFSNQCNYKCRTCWHGASSLWFTDAKAIANTAGPTHIILNIAQFNSFIEKVGPLLLDAQEIYLAGGEPLITPMHYQLLQWLIANKATQCHLRYNSNVSVLKFQNHDVLLLWKQFKKVTVMASIDETNALGEYIRWGMKWNKVKDNLTILKHQKHVQMQVAPTVSLLNIANFDLFVEQLIADQLFTPNQFYINILERPLQYNIQLLSRKKKDEIAFKLTQLISKYHLSRSFTAQIQQVIKYMQLKDQSSQMPKFRAYNQKLDALRNEKMPNNGLII